MKKIPSIVLASAPKGTIWFGGGVDKIVVSLRVRPKISTRNSCMGLNSIEPIVGKYFQRQNNCWVMKVRPTRSGCLDKQVFALFNKLPSSQKFWDSINEVAEIDLFVGVFMERNNRGMDISPAAMKMLGERGVELSLDIYGPEF